MSNRLRAICARIALPALLGSGGIMALHGKSSSAPVAQLPSTPPTQQEAREFTDAAEQRLLELWIRQQRAQWIQETYITNDTEEMAAEADEAVKAATSEIAAQARRYETLNLPPDVARKLKL